MVTAIPLSILVGAVVVATSVISGIFGMAGGLILMLILGVLLPVPAAMVLHGVTQFFSNGWRAVIWRQWIDWRIIVYYCVGAFPALIVPLALAYVPDKPVMLISLGVMPYAALMLPERWALDAAKPSHAMVCGFLVAGLQLVAGVAGPLLDTFFVRSAMDRRVVVATKAATQAISHTLKVGYYGVLLALVPDLGADVYGAAIISAIVGTTLAGPVLEKLSNENFRRWTKTIVLCVGAISVLQGLGLLLF